MKNKIIFSILIAITLLTSSCENNFDPQMYGQLYTSNFPKTESDYEALLMTCYIPFSVNWSYNLAGGSWQHGFYVAGDGFYRYFDATSDYCAPWDVNTGGGSAQQYTQANFANFNLFVRTDNNNPPEFEKLRDITRFTEIIGILGNSTVLLDTKKQNFIGEARFLRGMVMYYLLHIYGPVPVILDPSMVGNLVDEQNLERPTLTQMTQWITADLEYGVANMVATAPQGRYTANYARFCLMRHYLNEGSYMTGYYDKAIDMYNQLKTAGFGLYTAGGITAYADQFKQANKFNKQTSLKITN